MKNEACVADEPGVLADRLELPVSQGEMRLLLFCETQMKPGLSALPPTVVLHA